MTSIPEKEAKDIHKAIALEIMEEMQKGKDVSTLINKDHILDLINKVKDKDADYYLCHLDLKGTNQEKVKHFDENQNLIYKALVKQLKNQIDFDVELYKIGQSCNGLRKRNAAVFRNAFFSTKNTISEFNKEKAKDKTPYLEGCTIQEQQYENYQKNVKEAGGEWSNPAKKYRLIIKYNNPKLNKNAKGYFFLYFETFERMKEVEEMLFGLCLSNSKKGEIESALNKMKHNVENSFIFYGMLKLLGVKSKVQKRKELLSDFKSGVTNNIQAIKKEGQSLLSKNLLMKYKKKRNLADNLDIHCNSEVYLKDNARDQMKSRAKANANRVINPDDFPITSSYTNSEMFPMITGLPCSVQEEIPGIDTNGQSKKNIEDKFAKLGKEIKDLKDNENIISSSSNKGIMIEYARGRGSATRMECDQQLKGSIPDENKISQSNGVSINKVENKICFTDGTNEIASLDNNNIYDISNVFVNSNFEIDGLEENRVVILGPKKDPNIYFSYKYNDCDSTGAQSLKNSTYQKTLVDPEKLGLKFNNGSRLKKPRDDLLCVQLFHAVIDTSQNQIESRLKNDLLFFIEFTIQSNKNLKTILKEANVYKNNAFIVEFNKSFVFEKNAVFNENILPKEIKIDVYAISKSCFPNHYDEERKRSICKFLNPYLIGSTSITPDTINKKTEYTLRKNEQNIPGSKLFINVIEPNEQDSKNLTPTTGFMGWDYSIGADTYLVQEIDPNTFEQLKKNPYLTKDIIQQLYDVQCKEETDEILFRPPEHMTNQEFVESAKQNGIESKDIKKIIYNKKFKFLPVCEQYSKQNKFSSPNFASISNKEKARMETYHKEGNWIYKAEALNLRFLSKNLGVSDDKEYLQLNYFFHSRCKKQINLKDPDKDMYPISNNSFNVFDMNDLDANYLSNFDNYQWKYSFKFQNQNQSKVFLKALTQLRQQANHLQQKKNISNDIDYKLLLKYLNSEGQEDRGRIMVQIDSIEIKNDITLNTDAELVLDITKTKSESQNKGGKSLLENLELDFYDYKNSLVKNQEVKNEIESIKSMKLDKIAFDKKHIIKSNKIIEGNKALKFRNMIKEIPIQKNSPTEYDICCKFNDVKNKNKTLLEYTATINRSEIADKEADIIVIPLYDSKTPSTNIKGILTAHVWCESKNSNLTFDEALFKNPARVRTIKEVEFHDSQGLSFPKGRYEPNIFRRKFLQDVRDKFGKNLQDVLNDYPQRKRLLEFIDKKCVEHKNIQNESQLSSFDVKNIKLNISRDTLSQNSYLTKSYKRILKQRNRRAFYDNFSKNEWFTFLSQFDKSLQNKDVKNISDEELFGNFKEHKKQIFASNSINRVRDLLCLGFPSKEARKIFWEVLLDSDKLINETKDKIRKYENQGVINNNMQKDKDFIYQYFKDKVGRNKSTNIIFSLIDNDTNYIAPMKNEQNEYKYIENIKMITKAFFKWTDFFYENNKDSGTNNDTIESTRRNDTKETKKFVYFQGILSIVQRLRYYFDSDSQTFWFIVGFSQIFELFQQVNPLYNDEMSYINVYVLVTKLVIEQHYPNIYNKFYELNFPIEQFISKHLNNLYSEYFTSDLLFPFYDILIFEAWYSIENNDDKLKYLRILCTTPVTLFQLNSKKLLQAQSVSELETICDDFILKTLDVAKFIHTINSNLETFFFSEFNLFNWFSQNENKKWDNKRNDLQYLMYTHFQHVQEENIKHLKPLSKKISLGESEKFSNKYFDEIKNKLDRIRELYGYGTPNPNSFGDMMGIFFHINRLIQFSNKSNEEQLPQQMIAYISLSNSRFTFNKTRYNSEYNATINYSPNEQKINNENQLFFNIPIPSGDVKYLNVVLVDTNNSPLFSFSYDISKCEIMCIEKVTLESNERLKKYMLEISYMKYSNNNVISNDKELYKIVFEPPEYYHNIEIENKYSSMEPNKSKEFNEQIKEMIKKENVIKDKIFNSNISFKNNSTIKELFIESNVHSSNVDEYIKNIGKLFKEENEFNKKIIEEFKSLVCNLNGERKEQGKCPNTDLLFNWLNEKTTSFEEILYSLILTDKSSYSISEKMYMLFTVAQMKNRLLFNSDNVSIDKVKELFYALYKRYMIYFTKNEIDRMIDFAIKDEKILNVKYVLVYSSNDSKTINEYIYDIDRYPQRTLPKSNKPNNTCYYVNITKQLNVYINYLINHFNLKSINGLTMRAALTDIITSDKKLFNEMQTQRCNELKIIMENDNMHWVKEFTLKLNVNPIKIEEKKQNNNTGHTEDTIDECLQQESMNDKLIDTYSYSKEITFYQFKRIFFNLPFISDLLRVSCMFIKEDQERIDSEFNNLKISFYRDNNILSEFNFPGSPTDSQTNEFATGKRIKKSMTVKELIDEVKIYIRETVSNASGNPEIKEILSFINQPNLYECKVVQRETTEERLLYFDSLFSSIYLKNNSQANIKVELKPTEMTLMDKDLIHKVEGFGKVFYNLNTDDYKWNKCKVNVRKQEASFKLFDIQNKLQTCNTNYIEDIIGEGKANFNS